MINLVKKVCYLERVVVEGAKYPYGLKIESRAAAKEYFFSSPEPIQLMMDSLRTTCILRNFESNYSMLDKLGSGNFGKVRQAPIEYKQSHVVRFFGSSTDERS